MIEQWYKSIFINYAALQRDHSFVNNVDLNNDSMNTEMTTEKKGIWMTKEAYSF